MNAALLHSEENKKSKEDYDAKFAELGFIGKSINYLFSSMGKAMYRNLYGTPEFLGKVERAERIINNPQIKKVFCQSLKSKVPPNLMEEEIVIELVNVVTDALMKDEVAEEFSIERDVHLYSLIIFKVYKKGVKNFCR